MVLVSHSDIILWVAVLVLWFLLEILIFRGGKTCHLRGHRRREYELLSEQVSCLVFNELLSLNVLLEWLMFYDARFRQLALEFLLECLLPVGASDCYAVIYTGL